MGINNGLQKKKIIFYRRKKYLEKYKGKSVKKILHRILIFLLQNAINTFYNLYNDYWDLITKL